ncbi:hypothetical protein D3C80_1744690 [compost metagenome]
MALLFVSSNPASLKAFPNIPLYGFSTEYLPSEVQLDSGELLNCKISPFIPVSEPFPCATKP